VMELRVGQGQAEEGAQKLIVGEHLWPKPPQKKN
jgi:hypothetical protein